MSIFNNLKQGVTINKNIIAGIMFAISITGCASLKESLILGASSGATVGGIAGAQTPVDQSENTIKGAVLGGVIGGLFSYILHGSLEKRDAKVRRESLMNLEHFDVMGYENINGNTDKSQGSSKCYTTQEVDGRLVSVPCSLVNDTAIGDWAQ